MTIVIHPSLSNDFRQDVINWCTAQFGDMHNSQNLENRAWIMTSNYTRNTGGSFDMIFNDNIFATLFRMRWGGFIV